MPLAKNYEDLRSHWGYATICSDCARDIREGSLFRKGTNIKIVVRGYPLAERCDQCNREVLKTDESA